MLQITTHDNSRNAGHGTDVFAGVSGHTPHRDERRRRSISHAGHISQDMSNYWICDCQVLCNAMIAELQIGPRMQATTTSTSTSTTRAHLQIADSSRRHNSVSWLPTLPSLRVALQKMLARCKNVKLYAITVYAAAYFDKIQICSKGPGSVTVRLGDELPGD